MVQNNDNNHIRCTKRVENFNIAYLTTRKRAIAKALHLEGHSDFAPVDLA